MCPVGFALVSLDVALEVIKVKESQIGRCRMATVILLIAILLILMACSSPPIEMLSPTSLAPTWQEPAVEVSNPGQLPEFGAARMRMVFAPAH